MNDSDSRVEDVLRRYRPVGPAAELRERILQSTRSRRPRLVSAAGFAIAATVVFSFGLNFASERSVRKSMVALGIGKIEWTAEAEEYAQMLDGLGTGRRYIALALAADTCRRRGVPFQVPLAGN